LRNKFTTIRELAAVGNGSEPIANCQDCHNFDRPTMGKCSQHPQLSWAGTVFSPAALSAWQ